MTSNGSASPNAVSFDSSAVAARGASSTTSTSTVRPRNRRLISLADDSDDNNENESSLSSGLSPSSAFVTSGTARSRSQNPSPSPSSTRNPSPLPSTHPSRGTSSFDYPYHDGSPQRSRVDLRRGLGSQDRKPSSGFATNFLNSSWSSLQGLAATVMGSDASQGNGRVGSLQVNGTRHARKPSRAADSGSFRANSSQRPSRSPLPSSWGPSGLFGLKPSPGSKEERDALVQAKRREALLVANGESMPDSRGVHKRRNSGVDSALSRSMEEGDGQDALVYVHQVQPNDSLTGVSIRYGCQLAVLRKANGFWPSDTIQSRKTVVLPVDACTIKGRPIRSTPKGKPPMFDLMDDSPPGSSTLIPTEQSPYSEPYEEEHSDAGKSTNPSQPWKHECWVEVEGFTEPVELGRVSCRALGYFPRARRKSRSQMKPYSDLDDITSRSSSFARSRDDPFPGSPERQRDFAAIDFSPERFRDRSTSGSQATRPPFRHHRKRSSFTFNGPGGVGTLDRKAQAPGPAPDKLNSFINTHLPNLALPPPPTSEPANTHPTRPPRISFDSTSSVVSTSSSTGLENVGGAIEGWFRKVATRAKTSLNEIQQPSPIYSHLGLGGNGDLIELDDTRESTTRTVTPARSPRPQGSRAASATGRPGDGGSTRGRTMNSSSNVHLNAGARRSKDD